MLGWDSHPGRGTTRAEDAQGTPTQSHISPSILEYEDRTRKKCGESEPLLGAMMFLLYHETRLERIVAIDIFTSALVRTRHRTRQYEFGTNKTVKARLWLWLNSGLGFQIKILGTIEGLAPFELVWSRHSFRWTLNLY